MLPFSPAIRFKFVKAQSSHALPQALDRAQRTPAFQISYPAVGITFRILKV